MRNVCEGGRGKGKPRDPSLLDCGASCGAMIATL